MAETVHLTVAQATVRFLSQQYSESDGVECEFDQSKKSEQRESLTPTGAQQ